MDRRKFLNSLSAATAASIAGAGTLSAKADTLEEAMEASIGKRRAKPGHCFVDGRPARDPNDKRPYLQHNEPLLPKMPKAPTLMDFYKLRFSTNHVTQSARLAHKNGSSEKVVLACLLHDVGLNIMGTDHGYWAAQLVRPYVDAEIAWAIEKHQALRFFPDKEVGYEYPERYIEYFGEDYVPEPYLKEEHDRAKEHKWYMSSREITINDLYSFDRNLKVDVEDFTDIIGRNFRQPKEGLGFDSSPTAHMWRSMIWPNNFL
jgi:HD domain-containing protein